jgi:hypothetical protein
MPAQHSAAVRGHERGTLTLGELHRCRRSSDTLTYRGLVCETHIILTWDVTHC